MNGTASDIDRLRVAHPQWSFTSVWITVGTGPDMRILAATRQGIQVSAWDEAALSVKIADEETARAWPCQ